MIFFVLCQSCLQPFELSVAPSEVPLIKDICDVKGELCPCPRLCGGKINLKGDETLKAMATDPRLKPSMKLSGTELYQAVNGMGLPDEIVRDPLVIESLLKSQPIVDVDLVLDDSSKRVFLLELKLKNGVTIHLTGGVHGAEVLKITKEVSHVAASPG